MSALLLSLLVDKPLVSALNDSIAFPCFQLCVLSYIKAAYTANLTPEIKQAQHLPLNHSHILPDTWLLSNHSSLLCQRFERWNILHVT